MGKKAVSKYFYVEVEAGLEILPFKDIQVPRPEVDVPVVEVGGLAAGGGPAHLEIYL